MKNPRIVRRTAEALAVLLLIGIWYNHGFNAFAATFLFGFLIDILNHPEIKQDRGYSLWSLLGSEKIEPNNKWE